MGVKVTRYYFRRTPTMRELAEITARLHDKTRRVQKTKCLMWLGSKNELGYGQLDFQRDASLDF